MPDYGCLSASTRQRVTLRRDGVLRGRSTHRRLVGFDNTEVPPAYFPPKLYRRRRPRPLDKQSIGMWRAIRRVEEVRQGATSMDIAQRSHNEGIGLLLQSAVFNSSDRKHCWGHNTDARNLTAFVEEIRASPGGDPQQGSLIIVKYVIESNLR